MTPSRYERSQLDMLRAASLGTLPSLAAMMFDLEPDIERLALREVEPSHLEVVTPGYMVGEAVQARVNEAMPAGYLVTFSGAI